MARINHFDAPVPGQSLTETPGNAAWEHAPSIVDPNELVQFIYDNIMKPRNLKEFGFTVKSGATIEEIAKTVLFSGFMEGKWSVDAALLAYNAVIVMMGSVAKKLGLAFKAVNDKKPGQAELTFRKKDIIQKMKEEPARQIPSGGLMSPPEGLL